MTIHQAMGALEARNPVFEAPSEINQLSSFVISVFFLNSFKCLFNVQTIKYLFFATFRLQVKWKLSLSSVTSF